MASPTICISHATGAAGTEVGRLVAEQLGLRYVDDEVIGEAADWAGLDPAFVADAERRKSFASRLLGGMAGGGTMRLPTGEAARALPSDADLRVLISEAVSSIVRQGDAVIVAHAASFAVAAGEALRVFVTASPSTRAERLARERGVGQGDAEQAIRAEDAGRADYLKRFYGVEREVPTHYDLVVNTDALSPDAAAALVVAAVGAG
ncbi:MAG TPA: cytidylate kinase-like family protein [Gaiellaceae bacterium]